MKCSKCGFENIDDAVICEKCGFPFAKNVTPLHEQATSDTENADDAAASRSEEVKVKEQPRKERKRRALFIALAWIAGLIVFGIGVYKLVYWVQDYQIRRLYTRGAYTPVLTETTDEDGREAHALVFYGSDGDKIYLPERNQSLTICGGVARLQVADSDWFEGYDGDFDYADITFNPVLIRENGSEVQLPTITYQIEAPSAPLTVTSPAADNLNINTSTYPLELQVVSGSSVYINGEDVSDRLDRSGYLSANLKVQPIGDNVYTIVVRTPNHKETRRDITIYREHYDIEIEMDSTVSNTSTEDTAVVSGKVEPGASVTVETDYMEESYQMDMNTGKFSFIAKLSSLGDNVVRFRATMPGRQDAVINLTITYTPSYAQYTAKAWAMDYEQLRKYFENWRERIFKCDGTILDKFTEDNMQYLIMNVNPEGEQQLIVLQNYSDIDPTIGGYYTLYGDVQGRRFYETDYFPMLAARYIDTSE